MIGLRAQSNTMFVEAGPEFTSSGSPKCGERSSVEREFIILGEALRRIKAIDGDFVIVYF